MVATDVPRPEHPRPQFEREAWLNLNGVWTFDYDWGDSGLERDFQSSRGFSQRINVPFCPESKLSGIQNRDFMRCVWYQREIAIPSVWAGKRIILHFGAVDYETSVFIDGKLAGRHWGGMCSFSFDITHAVRTGSTHNVTVRAYDDTRQCGSPSGGSGTQPGGKQVARYASYAASYTRTTGIWQTVWLEAVGRGGLESCQVIPDLDGAQFVFIPKYREVARGLKFRVVVKDEGRTLGFAEATAQDNVAAIFQLERPRTWNPEDPFLYELEFQVVDPAGREIDRVKSYAGLRKIHSEGNRLYLNNQPLYLRFVLDQGFYPDGIWTAPSDAELRGDVERGKAAGFNGARLHQKVFEERFHYWADKLGYLTWGETSSWGADPCFPLSARNFLPEWTEVIVRDRNHPSIIAWTAHNETRSDQHPAVHDRLLIESYRIAKALDPTRPVNDASGHTHMMTDLWTIHDYAQDPAQLRARLVPQGGETVLPQYPKAECAYAGQPYIVAEFGGIKWVRPQDRIAVGAAWGYGKDPSSLEEFYERLERLVEALNSIGHLSGWCYTQLTDVEQETNGIYTYDRTPKFHLAKIKAIFEGRKTSVNSTMNFNCL